MFSKKSRDGEVFLDHSNSPGIPRDKAEQMGLPSVLVGEGKKMHAATLGCKHCGGHVVLNPMRTRERAWCSACDAYICDGCDYLRKQPGYLHITMSQLADMVKSGKFTISGTLSNLTITPKTEI